MHEFDERLEMAIKRSMRSELLGTNMINYDIFSWGNKTENAGDILNDFDISFENLVDNDKKCLLTQSEIDQIDNIIKSARERLKKGIMGIENVTRYERDKNIDKIVK